LALNLNNKDMIYNIKYIVETVEIIPINTNTKPTNVKLGYSVINANAKTILKKRLLIINLII
jgi:hypothetical protein